ncbi:hypothetical protein FNU76_10175 [Chitinimonas arctica]|uniref:Uncharacterized protein n=1 Tax=Chitinimonas arctica TaxID=2594795 RepID=A0A516SF17_9NEIS|nr:hypothetical protein [Chitinimonas arctica]QDQ26700.1 hypothetical protein FNU76_10175 [Chitinimonas arctica]
MVVVQFNHVQGGVTTPYRISDIGYLTGPADTPANTMLSPRLQALPRYSRSISADGERSMVGGQLTRSFGEVSLINNDGALDFLLGLNGLVDQPVQVYWVPDPVPSPLVLSEHQLFVARCGAPTFDSDLIRIPLHEVESVLERPFLKPISSYPESATLFDPASLAVNGNRNAPRVFGKVRGVEPILVDATRNIYLISDHPATVVLFDKGVMITGFRQGSLPLIYSPPPSPGTAKYFPGDALTPRVYACLGSTPELLTAHVTSASTPSYSPNPDKFVYQAVVDLVQAVLPGQGVGSDLHAFLTSIGTGWLARELDTPMDGIRFLLSSIDGWFGYNRHGGFQCGVIKEPSAPSYSLPAAKIREVSITWQGGGYTARQVTAKVGRAYTVLQQVAPTVIPTFAALLRREWIERKSAAATTPELYQFDRIISTALDQDDAGIPSVLAAIFAKYDTLTRIYSVDLVMTRSLALAIEIGQCVNLTWPRYDLANGKPLIVIGIDMDLETRALRLRLWG